MDDAMLDGTVEMERFVRIISNEPDIAKAAFMIDSSKWETILAGLKNTQGKCIVDSSDLWVIANYRETQLSNIREGADVEMTADAVPGVTFKGIVESISDATGAAFSMIPQDNATGNFVKVEQRIPVRISLKGNKTEDLKRLRAGFNVECEVKY